MQDKKRNEALQRVISLNIILVIAEIASALIALLVNVYSTCLLSRANIKHCHEGEKHHHDHESRYLNITSAYLHMLRDAVISLSVAIRADLAKIGIKHFIIQPETQKYSVGNSSCQRH